MEMSRRFFLKLLAGALLSAGVQLIGGRWIFAAAPWAAGGGTYPGRIIGLTGKDITEEGRWAG